MRFQSIVLYLAGILTIVIAAMHVGIPMLRGWFKELKELSQPTRRTILDRNYFLIILLLIMAVVIFMLNEDMQKSDTGRALLTLLGLYWILRGVWRYAGFPKEGMTSLVAITYFVTGICFFLAMIP